MDNLSKRITWDVIPDGVENAQLGYLQKLFEPPASISIHNPLNQFVTQGA
jgi:hypothetical protein